jgi:hypothetical protein
VTKSKSKDALQETQELFGPQSGVMTLGPGAEGVLRDLRIFEHRRPVGHGDAGHLTGPDGCPTQAQTTHAAFLGREQGGHPTNEVVWHGLRNAKRSVPFLTR